MGELKIRHLQALVVVVLLSMACGEVGTMPLQGPCGLIAEACIKPSEPYYEGYEELRYCDADADCTSANVCCAGSSGRLAPANTRDQMELEARIAPQSCERIPCEHPVPAEIIPVCIQNRCDFCRDFRVCTE